MNIFKKKMIRGDSISINPNLKEKTNSKKTNSKKTIKIILLSIAFVLLLVGVTVFFIVRIPFKYCGTYISYFYFYGEETKYTYKISPLSIKLITEYKENGKLIKDIEKIKYYKSDGDIIIKDSYSEKYIIIEDDCLYLESNKDISFSKKYGNFYWNIKSTKSDLYEIENKADGFEDMIETITNGWSRKLIYDVAEKQLNNSNFYILNSDEETDKTDLNSYEVKFKAAGGELTLYYDRKTKEIDHIYFSGHIQSSLYGSYLSDSMDIEDMYDCRAMLLAIMYILGSNDKENLMSNISNLNTTEDLVIRTIVSFDYDDLFENKKVDDEYENKVSYSLDNERYDITFENWITSSVYSFSGIVSFRIYVK